ncbi:MAG: Na(+)/H(+) antiporter subunit C [Nitriliruptorales bacterium]|nr:Na(+)/H(+) antiporter subunit C [Nitriliruptorales bacterium]
MVLTLAVTVGALYAVGVWLLLQRSLSRIVIGLVLLGHGANLLLLAAGGSAGQPPFAGADPATTADPLPQALALTAIVITFGVSAFLLSLTYRSWTQRQDDEVEDDVEDRRIADMRRRLDEESVRHDADELVDQQRRSEQQGGG